MTDDKLIEDLDDLSDLDKVSLISDIEVRSKDHQSNNLKKFEEKELNLKGIDQISKELNQRVGVKKSNGLSMTNNKFKCSRSNSCSSCHKLPLDPCIKGIGNQE